jgi:hypothetical protein
MEAVSKLFDEDTGDQNDSNHVPGNEPICEDSYHLPDVGDSTENEEPDVLQALNGHSPEQLK